MSQIHIEKSMIRDDLEFALSVAKENPTLSFQLLPYICLVALESASYLSIPTTNERLSSIRAKAKFLDDKKIDIGKTLDLLRQTREDHSSHFTGLHKWWQFSARAQQTDIAECRYDGRFLGTTNLFYYYISSSSSAVTLSGLQKGELRDVGIQVGQVLGKIIDTGEIDIDRDVDSIKIYDKDAMIGTDYKSKKYFAGKFGGRFHVDMVQYLQMLISMLNTIYYVIGNSAVNCFSLFKIRYITFFHVLSSIQKLQAYFRLNGLRSPESDVIFTEILSGQIPKKMRSNKKFRNILVHYRISDLTEPSGTSNNAYGLVEASFDDIIYSQLDTEISKKIARTIHLLEEWMLGST